MSPHHPSTSRLQVLAQLQQYSNLSSERQQDTFKSCLWHLYKARRKSYNGGFMASFDSNFNANHLIREEFSATTVVELVVEKEEEEPPTLVCDEDNGSSNNNNKSQQPPPMEWRLVSVMDGEETQNDTTTTSSTIKSNEAKEGNLRQRRGPKQTTTTTKSSKMQEEKEFINPLTLFGGGLVPPELKLAQNQAKLALQQYIQAANAVVKIQTALNHHYNNNNNKNNNNM
eukprot:scaffold22583_cov106-Cylindrotheca_fusiformis.AAC.14